MMGVNGMGGIGVNGTVSVGVMMGLMGWEYQCSDRG